MPKESAGLLLFRRRNGGIEVFLAHPGGPFWMKKDSGAWSIPKGEFLEGEEPLQAARREFTEEIGQPVEGEFIALTPCKQPSRKIVHAFAIEADADPEQVRSNTFEMEWPPRSGQKQAFPEIDRAAWFSLDEARLKLQQGQVPILEELRVKLGR